MKFGRSIAFLSRRAFFRPEALGACDLLKYSSPFTTPYSPAIYGFDTMAKLHPDELFIGTSSVEALEWNPSVLSQEKETQRKSPKMTWEQKFALLRLFKRVFGHCNVPPNFVLFGIKLGGWLDTQRKEYQKHRLGFPSAIINEKRIARLERVGMEWGNNKSWTTATKSMLLKDQNEQIVAFA